MTQETFPEIQSAAQALEQRISKTEAEVSQLYEVIGAKETLIRRWRDVISTLGLGGFSRDAADPFDAHERDPRRSETSC
jgi:hypothetical protein